MSLEILADNWDMIVNKVIEPLWKYKFKKVYQSFHMDKQDFESLADEELVKAFLTYDPEKSDVYTYAKNVLIKKAITELRNNTQRDKRKAHYLSDSLNQPCGRDNEEELMDTIEDMHNRETADNELSELRVGRFVNSLSNQELRVLILKLLDFDKEIPDMLDISKKDMKNILKGMRNTENYVKLNRRVF